MFIKLTSKFNGNPLWVNMDHVINMTKKHYPNDGTLLEFIVRSHNLVVKESPEQILALLRETN